MESSEKGIEGAVNYASYQKLLGMRWKGILPVRAREHFMARVAAVTPDMPEEERLNIIVRNFGSSLLHHQFMILKTPGGLSPLNCSFVAPAPEIAPHLQKARVDLRSVSPRITKKSLAPWSSKGYFGLKKGEFQPLVKSWSESLACQGNTVEGYLTASAENLSVRLRADFLKEGGEG